MNFFVHSLYFVIIVVFIHLLFGHQEGGVKRLFSNKTNSCDIFDHCEPPSVVLLLTDTRCGQLRL